MSTFNGQVLEFPDIRVDFFRPSENARPPLACFLSHVHSDHLAGLESFRAPFVYCSASTREILLRLEKFPHRVNFQRGVLEARKQTYRHLKYLLKPLQLETPTRIELAPGNEIQVTLFDANHCTGAVMFLIEGAGKAILYTGDIRSEPWHVNNLRRNPILMEYTSGIKKLDCFYLDTTFLEDIHFPTKAEGLAELLKKIKMYPPETNFHFKAWTFGYEEVWIALSKALKSGIHVDQYKLGLYKSLCKSIEGGGSQYLCNEASALIGHQFANNYQKGCLTDEFSARIHSCELSMKCPGVNKNTVFIQPILARGANGVELLEVGAGGGEGDLVQQAELELDSNKAAVERLVEFLKNAKGDVAEAMKAEIMKKVQAGRGTVSLEDIGLKNDEEMSLDGLIKLVSDAVPKKDSQLSQESASQGEAMMDDELPRRITFPYSRHSSFEELCDLVSAFQPADVYPCTVDERRWYNGATMKSLFGQYCDKDTEFRHDREMAKRYGPAGAALSQDAAESVTDLLDLPLRGGLKISPAKPASKRKATEILTSDEKRTRTSHPNDASLDFSTLSVQQTHPERSIVPEGDVQAGDADTVSETERNSAGEEMIIHNPGDETCSATDSSDERSESDESAYRSLVRQRDGPQIDMYGNVWDEIDQVHRCPQCFWEKWHRWIPCSCLEEDFSDCDNNWDAETEIHRGSEYDAYDFMTDEQRHNEQYEIDSFIDDSELHARNEDFDSSVSDADEDAYDHDYPELYLAEIHNERARLNCLRSWSEEEYQRFNRAALAHPPFLQDHDWETDHIGFGRETPHDVLFEKMYRVVKRRNERLKKVMAILEANDGKLTDELRALWPTEDEYDGKPVAERALRTSGTSQEEDEEGDEPDVAALEADYDAPLAESLQPPQI